MIYPKLKALECSQHFSHFKFMGIFLDAKGQLTPQSLAGSCWISNPFEIFWLILLPARMKKIKSKVKKLECSQDFPHYNHMGVTYICCHGNQSARVVTSFLDGFEIQSGPKPNAAFPPFHWCSRWNFILTDQQVSEIFMFESVDVRTHELTDTRTPARVPYYKLSGSLQLRWAKKKVMPPLWNNSP